MTRRHGLPQIVLATALLVSMSCLPSLGAPPSGRTQGDVCMTHCGRMEFSTFISEVKDCGARRDLGTCRQHAEGHYTSPTPCRVTINLRPLGPGTRITQVEYKGDSSWSFDKQSLILDVKTGIVVKRLTLTRPPDQCEPPSKQKSPP